MTEQVSAFVTAVIAASGYEEMDRLSKDRIMSRVGVEGLERPKLIEADLIGLRVSWWKLRLQTIRFQISMATRG